MCTADSQIKVNTVIVLMQHLLKIANNRTRRVCALLAVWFCASIGLSAQVLADERDLSASLTPEKNFIIGGTPVQQDSYPWTVALAHVANASLVQRQFCGGSVIADTWVLTAAHCLFDRSGDLLSLSDFTVATNARNLRDANAQEHVVSNAYLHPDYNHNAINPHSDLALLELATSTGVTPVALSTTATANLVGLQGTVIGWGAVDYTDPASPLFPDQQYAVDVPVVTLDVCNAPISYAGSILENQLCAGFAQGGRDSCVGDSGGPMVVTYQGVVQQVGVVSFGFGCALPNYYGIYTNVPYFIGWINQYVFVGEPEFEPEASSSRGTTAISSTGSSSTGSTSLLVLLMLGAGLLARRRS